MKAAQTISPIEEASSNTFLPLPALYTLMSGPEIENEMTIKKLIDGALAIDEHGF
jgi:hypothetical protein